MLDSNDERASSCSLQHKTLGPSDFQRPIQDVISDSQAADGIVVQARKPTIQVLSSIASPSTYQLRITTCKTELQQLIQQKREQCNAERIAKQMMENAEWESKPPPPGDCLRILDKQPVLPGGDKTQMEEFHPADG